jgi:hypothetical protein
MEALRGFSSAPDLCGCSRNFETDSVATCIYISHNYEMSIVFFPQASPHQLQHQRPALRDQDAAGKSRKPRQCANAEWKLRWRGCPGPGKTEPGQQKDKCNQGKMQRQSPINLNKITS